MKNEPVAWRSKDNDGYWSIYQSPVEGAEPLYTHPAKNNGGNPEELNTRQIQDARTSLESTPPFAYAVVSKECPDGMENMSLQFNEPVEAKKIISLYTHPAKTLTDDEIDSIAMSCEVGDRFNQAGDEIYTRDFARAILRKASE